MTTLEDTMDMEMLNYFRSKNGRFEVTLSNIGGVLSAEAFATIEEAREFVRKEWLPILDVGDTITFTERD